MMAAIAGGAAGLKKVGKIIPDSAHVTSIPTTSARSSLQTEDREEELLLRLSCRWRRRRQRRRRRFRRDHAKEQRSEGEEKAAGGGADPPKKKVRRMRIYPLDIPAFHRVL